MEHRRYTHRFRRTPVTNAAARVTRRTVLAAATFGALRTLGAQAPPAPAPAMPQPPASVQGVMAPYRAPAIALVQPGDGGTVHQDRPVIVLRFAPGEPGDLLDVGSLVIAVDGVDRTALFQSSVGEAWGPLATATSTTVDSALALGPHPVTARICSVRGACATVHATVNVLPSHLRKSGDATDAATGLHPARSRTQRLRDAALEALRRLLMP